MGSAILDAMVLWWTSAKWTDFAEYLFVALSVLGQHHISHRRVTGFHFWFAGNVIAIVLFFSLERYATSCLYVYFLYKCLEGVRVWRSLELQGSVDRKPV